jgi:hypothetical protein
VIQYVIIVFSALIPVINVIGPSTSSQEGSVTSTTLTQVLSAVFGALIVMLVGILQFEKFHDKWLLFKRTAVDLRREYYNWKNCVGDYKCEKGREGNLALLIERCETILKDETGEYLRYFSNSSTSTNQGREEGSKMK